MESIDNILEDEWQLDEEVRHYLNQTAVLAKFIALLGICFSVLTTVKTGSGIVKNMATLKAYYFYSFYGMMNIVVALLAGVIYFSVSLYTYRFAIKLQQSLLESDQQLFNQAWDNFKLSFKILGIMFIIYIAMMALSVLL
ncbi:MAG: hypothetical protein EOO06_02330 [Chitinophagaceae bacterium]|nr:MAG: hypothetical protein EOO06_02330 [Chitinophagaceae bacterium]